jgi:hypothetical protein
MFWPPRIDIDEQLSADKTDFIVILQLQPDPVTLSLEWVHATVSYPAHQFR